MLWSGRSASVPLSFPSVATPSWRRSGGSLPRGSYLRQSDLAARGGGIPPFRRRVVVKSPTRATPDGHLLATLLPNRPGSAAQLGPQAGLGRGPCHGVGHVEQFGRGVPAGHAPAPPGQQFNVFAAAPTAGASEASIPIRPDTRAPCPCARVGRGRRDGGTRSPGARSPPSVSQPPRSPSRNRRTGPGRRGCRSGRCAYGEGSFTFITSRTRGVPRRGIQRAATSVTRLRSSAVARDEPSWLSDGTVRQSDGRRPTDPGPVATCCRALPNWWKQFAPPVGA